MAIGENADADSCPAPTAELAREGKRLKIELLLVFSGPAPTAELAREGKRLKIELLLVFSGMSDSMALTTSSSLAFRISSRIARLCCGKIRCRSSIEFLYILVFSLLEKGSCCGWGGEILPPISPSLVSLLDRLRPLSLEVSPSKLSGLTGSSFTLKSPTSPSAALSSSLDGSRSSQKKSVMRVI